MTKQEKIKLVDDLIKENPDYRIRDYLEVVAEVEGVETSPGLSEGEGKPSCVVACKAPGRPGRKQKRGSTVKSWGILNNKSGDMHLLLIGNTESNA